MRAPLVKRARELNPRWMRFLLDLPFVGVAICDAADRRWIRFNARFCAMVGYERAELERMHWRDLCHPGDRIAANAAFRRLLARRAAHVRATARLLRKDGRAVPIEVDLSYARSRGIGAGNHVVALVTESGRLPATDVEAETEAAHRDTEEKLHAVVEQSITGICIVENGCFSYANPRMAEIFGYAAGEIAGRPAAELVAPQDRDRVAENIRRRLSGEIDSLQYEFHGLRKDGSVIEVGVHGTAARIRGQRVIIGVVQDITERARADRRIKDYVRKLEAATLGAVAALSRMVDLRDPYTAGHERRVAGIAAVIGREFGMSGEQLRPLEIAGRVHDIGKISVPTEILSKPTRLSGAEFEIVKLHVANGYDILKAVDFPWPVADMVRQHHERLDGSGYPQALKDGQIVLEGRILAVADVIEAMGSHRPYRAAVGIGPALDEIERGAGPRYDADVSACALRLFRDKGYCIPD